MTRAPVELAHVWYPRAERGREQKVADRDDSPATKAIDGDDLPPADLDVVLEILARRGCVLRDYRPAPLGRRVLARMEALGLSDVSAYVERLCRDATEADRLADALLVQVTSFFRDPAVFTALATRVLPELLGRAARSNRPLRAWVVGASTGQEAYSLAMILSDLGGAAGVPFEVLATDRSELVLDYARRGLYTDDEVASLPAEARGRFVVEDPRGRRVLDHVRERVSFHQHDLLGPRLAPRESIVASFDIVLCRNVLIYFEPRSLAQAVHRFSDIVPVGGALILGPAESVPVASRRFAPYPGVAQGLRIYTRTPGAPADEAP